VKVYTKVLNAFIGEVKVVMIPAEVFCNKFPTLERMAQFDNVKVWHIQFRMFSAVVLGCYDNTLLKQI